MDLDVPFPATIIRKVTTRFGPSYVVESDVFQFFLPKAYSACEIRQYDEYRKFIVRMEAGVRRIHFFRSVDSTPDMME